MPIVVTTTGLGIGVELAGTLPRRARLGITGLTAGAGNTVPHGLPAAPRSVILVPGGSASWGETSAADATNIYITVGAGGATSGTAYVEY